MLRLDSYVTASKKIVAAFRGMHVLPAKHSYVSVTGGQTDRQTDRQTDGQTDGRTDHTQSDPYVSLCFTGDTKTRSWTENLPKVCWGLVCTSTELIIYMGP